MKNKLKIITDKTIQEVLNNEIILPSQYFECFDKTAKEVDEKYENNINSNETKNLIIEEFNLINKYMDTSLDSINKLQEGTRKAQEAINNNDQNSLTLLTSEMKVLQNELILLKQEIYKDTYTSTFNRKYLFKEVLDTKGNTKDAGLFVYVKISDYDYLLKEHNSIIADNLLLFIIKFLKTSLKEEKIDFTMIRYYQNTFIIKITKSKKELLENIFVNLINIIKDRTLKSKSGIIIQPKFLFSIYEYKQNDNFINILEDLI